MPLPLAPLVLFGLALFGSGGSKRAPKGETEAQRIARLKKQIADESADIIHGNRDQYSDEVVDGHLADVVKNVDSAGSSTTQPVKPVDESIVKDNATPHDDEALDLAIKEAVEAADSAPAPENPDDPEIPAPGPSTLDEAQVIEDIAEVTNQTQPVDPRAVDMTVTEADIANYSGPATEPYANTTAQIPAGYDPAGARRMAPSLARHLKNKGASGYDRRLLADFQKKAGIDIDKIYGGQSWGALLHYGGTDAPKAFYEPKTLVPYTPPA